MSNQFLFSEKEKEIFKKLSVSALVLFGSQAQKLDNPFSDYDFGILITDKTILYQSEKRQEIYDTLYDMLSDKIKKLIDIDIIFLENAPYELQAHVIKYGQVLYEDSLMTFNNYKAKMMLMYSDFAPLRMVFQQAILDRIK